MVRSKSDEEERENDQCKGVVFGVREREREREVGAK